jgi:glutathione peroxidase
MIIQDLTCRARTSTLGRSAPVPAALWQRARGALDAAPLALALAAAFALAMALTAPARAADPAPKAASDPVAAAAAPAPGADCPELLRLTFNSLQTGQPQPLCPYKGKVLLIVNTASYCGYTGQYEGLEALYRKYRDRGLVVLGFPSNDYGAQEPGTNKEIADFCRTTYGIEFPMFEKAAGVRVAANPLYVQLIGKTRQAPQWNFHKYLVNRSGTRIASFASKVEPSSAEFTATLEKMLAEKPAS